MFLFAAFWVGCVQKSVELSTVLTPYGSLPNRLHTQHCPDGSVLKTSEEKTHRIYACMNQQNQMHGPELFISAEMKRLSYFDHGTLRQTPHLTHLNGEPHHDALMAYAAEVGTSELALDLLKKEYSFLNAFQLKDHLLYQAQDANWYAPVTPNG